MANKDEILERFQKYRNEIIRATANSILRNTIQFFQDDSNNMPAAYGSGVLISVAERYFMVTAAHVLAEDYNNTFIILPDKELQLGGKLHFTPMPESGKREDDMIDLAVMELDPKVVIEILEYFRFITLDNIEISHKIQEPQHYLSVGYPGDKTEIIKDEIKAVPFVYLTEAVYDFDYVSSDMIPQSHIAVKFDGFITSESNPEVHAAPNLGGISGSGLWVIRHMFTPNSPTSKQLVGIVIKYIITEKNQTAVIATRMDVVTEFIRQHFNVDIPKSKIININFL